MQIVDTPAWDSRKAEAEARWGQTEAYAEHQEKTKGYTPGLWNDLAEAMNGIFAEFAQCKATGEAPDSAHAQSLVKKLQDFITDNYYTCTRQILAGLGQMYIADERFRNNIDRQGVGTAAFVSEAIGICCGR